MNYLKTKSTCLNNRPFSMLWKPGAKEEKLSKEFNGSQWTGSFRFLFENSFFKEHD